MLNRKELNCLHKLFEKQVLQTPNATALIEGDQNITYKELNEKANQIAHFLIELGVKNEEKVGICLKRSSLLFIATLGVLKAGGTYVPIDPTYPEARKNFMLKDSNITILVTQNPQNNFFANFSGSLIYLDLEERRLNNYNLTDPLVPISPSNACYVIYTSGSSGLPHGVIGEHKAILNRFEWMWEVYPFNEDDVCCAKTAISFIDSVWEMFGPLLKGIKIAIIPEDSAKDPWQLVKLLNLYKVTRIVLIPSFLRIILDSHSFIARELPHLDFWVSSGETLTLDIVKRFHDMLPGRRLLNLYGSSEVAADVTSYETTPPTENNLSIPIGKPIFNVEIHILDGELKPVPVGGEGELCIAGLNLARGYLNQPELTVQKFIANPLTKDQNDRLYRTGDLARFLSDGNIEYLGRIDQQIKIRGFRIEIGEIETVIRQHQKVYDCAVVMDEINGNKKLIAYIVPRNGIELDKEELQRFLNNHLIDFQQPSEFILITNLPHTPNGKLDKEAFSKFSYFKPNPKRKFTAPHTFLEETICEICSNVLGISNMSVTDNFFDLGGHSLMAMQVVSQAKQRNIPLTLSQFMQANSLREVCDLVTNDNKKNAPQYLLGKVNCLPQQIQLFNRLNNDQHNKHNINAFILLKRELNIFFLKKTIDYIMDQHDGLRSRFLFEFNEWCQYFEERETNEVFYSFDFSELDKNEIHPNILKEATKLQNNIDIETGPLIQIAMFKTGPTNLPYLFVLASHFICDEISLEILLEDLEFIYLQIEKGEQIRLLTKTTSIKQYSVDLHHFLKHPKFLKSLNYWLKNPLEEMNQQGPIPKTSERMNRFICSLPPRISEILMQKIPQNYSIKLLDLLLTSLISTLKDWNKKTIQIIRLVRHNRNSILNEVDLIRTIGLIRVHQPIYFIINQTSSIEDIFKDIQNQLKSTVELAEPFYLGTYCLGNREISQKLQSYVDQADAHLNLMITNLDTNKTSLYNKITNLNLGGIQKIPDKTLRLYVQVETNGALSFSWFYYKYFYQKEVITKLAEEFNSKLILLMNKIIRGD